MGVGGPARWFTCPADHAQLSEALDWSRTRGIELFLLGGGSNLVVADRGLDCLVVDLRALRGIQFDDERVRVASGEPWDAVVSACVDRGLAGIECLSGIPGLTGATPIQNVGAYGQEVADVVSSVNTVDRGDLSHAVMTNADCEFGYRDSVFKRRLRNRRVVTEVELTLHDAPRPSQNAELARALPERATVTQIRHMVLSLRRSKGMVLDPASFSFGSAGSFFMNPIVDNARADEAQARARAATMPRYDAGNGKTKLAAGWLIEKAGFFKGMARGRAAISPLHALALVNLGGATASEIVTLAREVRDGVLAKLGVHLVPEPELVGFVATEIADLYPG